MARYHVHPVDHGSVVHLAEHHVDAACVHVFTDDELADLIDDVCRSVLDPGEYRRIFFPLPGG